jgi:pimeloyl-ACP methyl ester carboxylesterase
MTGRLDSSATASRKNFAISPHGFFGVCLRESAGSTALERWSLRDVSRVDVPWPSVGLEAAHTQSVVSDNGAVFVTRPAAGHCEVTHLDPSLGDGRVLGRVARAGLRLLASPGADDAVALGFGHEDGRTRLWRISGRSPELSDPVVDVPGLLRGGAWLDAGGTLLAVNQTADDGTFPAVIDLSEGSWRELPLRSAHVVLASPSSGQLLIAVADRGALRFALADPQGTIRGCNGLNTIAGALCPLAFDPAGHRLAVAVNRGVRTHLFEYNLAADTAREVDVPPGIVRAPTAWHTDRLHVTFSAPRHPTGFASLRGEPLAWQHTDPLASSAPAHAEWLPGADGPIEAVVYGGADWRGSSRLLIALHGGPEAAWQLGYEPLFQRLAGAGIAVLAPNQRGSTGYGPAHRLAIRGAWGGPDLADIVQLGRQLAAERAAVGLEAPMLYGTSYGAFLALLSAALEPEAWSRCVAVAGYASGAALYAEADTPVRNFIERLGGRTPIADPLGPRDATRLCSRIRAPLLLVHGERDPLIPVSQARRLRSALVDGGRRPGVDFEYVEVPGAGHDPLEGPNGGALCERLLRFLTNSGESERG